MCCSSAVSTSAMRLYGDGGTGSVHCLPLRSGSAAFMMPPIPDGAGTWTRCLSGSMVRRITSGVRWTMKARCSRFLPRSVGTAGQH